MIKIRVPGKIHLVGEHSVVYGEPAIIAALDRHVSVEIRTASAIFINGKEFDIDETKRFSQRIEELWQRCMKNCDFSELSSIMKSDNNFIRASAGYMLDSLQPEEGVKIDIKSDIPRGAGMGSSAAISVAIVASFSSLFKNEFNRQKINSAAFELERFLHGTPSGGDNSACCFGGFLWFRKGENSIEMKNLGTKDSGIFDNFIVANTGIPKLSTCELVQNVRRTDPSIRDPVIKDLGKITSLMKEALEEGDSKRIVNLINRTWDNLSKLGLSTPNADSLISKIRKAGGAAKLCGACGGGTLLAYHEDVDMIRKLVNEAGYQPARIKLGVEGVTTETVSP